MRAVVHKVDRVFDGFFRLEEAEVSYERPDGSMSDPVRRLSFERGDSAAAVVADTDRGVVLLTRQFRYSALRSGDAWLLELAAGSILDGESPEACIRRELVEELGYQVPTLTPLGTFYTTPGGSSERIHLFYAEVDSSMHVSAGGGVAGEEIEIVAFTRPQIAELLANGKIVDAKTLIGLSWLMQAPPIAVAQ